MSISNVTDPESLALSTFAENAYLEYAISVVKGRALPDISDGQKPVQRRILYTMSKLSLSAGTKPRKSALVVGNVLGKLHPHGDQSVYDALVRMTRDFSMRYPLIEGQGNFGSRDGDNAAAMRYTETSLQPIAALLLEEIDAGAVEFRPNYDGSNEEPKLLPARLPFVLLNGSSGIAVGMATEIPSHNLQEVARALIELIRQPDLSHSELMKIIPGPDFPCGGQIITPPNVISEIYEVGRGNLRVRATWEIEYLTDCQWQVVITELPPGISSQKILETIEELTNPKIKIGRKTLSEEQLSLKIQVLSMLRGVRDESGRHIPVRLIFEPISKCLEQKKFISMLLTYTSLESNTSVNLVMIGKNGHPNQKNIGIILREWIDFRFSTVTNRSKFRLQKIEDRIHILKGREDILYNIKKTVDIIQNSEEPKTELTIAFGLSNRQADDITEIRLRQLTRLEGIKIKKERAALENERSKILDILSNPDSMKSLVIEDIENSQRKFGDDRRTLIKASERSTVKIEKLDEPVFVVVSKKGWIRIYPANFQNNKQFIFKPGDSLHEEFECRTTDNLLAFTSKGHIYSVPVESLSNTPSRDGIPITALINLANDDDIIVHYFAGQSSQILLLSSSGGYGFTSRVENMLTRSKSGKDYVTIKDGEVLLPPKKLENFDFIACFSKKGNMLVFSKNECKALTSGGRGSMLMDLEDDEVLLAVQPIDKLGMMISGVSERGGIKETTISRRKLELYVAKRGIRGKALKVNFKPESLRIHAR